MAIEAARLFVKVGADTREGEAGLNSFNDKLNAAARHLTMTGGLLTAGVTLPLVAAGKQALSSAADFEQSMNILQQVTGASAAQMGVLNTQALDLGAVTSFSAGEAADAMLELGKAGMGVESIMSAIPGVLDLAAAGGVDMATAANVTASALNAFGLEASQSTYVANLLAAAANASAADMSDLAQGLQQGGFAFAATGQNIDDLVASLAILTNVGLTGSDAGTALKNAMTRLINPTQEATDLMAQLGLVTTDYAAMADYMSQSLGRQVAPTFDGVNDSFREYAVLTGLATEGQKDLTKTFATFSSNFGNNRFFDAAGDMRSFDEIIGILNESLAGMTMEQRNNALATIFLSDGMKAMIPLLEVGQDGFLAMKDAVNEEGTVARVADARMAGLAGAVEYFKGSVDSFLITTAMPYLNMLGNMIRRGADLFSNFGQMSAGSRNAALAFLAVLAAAGPVIGGLGAVAASVAFLLTPLGLAVAASAALAAAWAGDFGGIQGITERTFGAVQATLINWWNTAAPYVEGAQAALQVLWAGLTGQGDVDTVIANLGLVQAAFGTDFANAVSDAGLAVHDFVIGLNEDVVAGAASLRLLWALLGGSSSADQMISDLDLVEQAFGGDFVSALEDAAGAIGTITEPINAFDLSAALTQMDAFIAKAKEMVPSDLFGETKDFAATVAGNLKATVITEIDWGQLKVNGEGLVNKVGAALSSVSWSDMVLNAQGMVTRAGERLSAAEWSDLPLMAQGMVTRAGELLSALPWSTMSVDFGGLLSAAGQKITEQANKYFGEDNLISRTVERISGTLALMQDDFAGASIDQPLDLLRKGLVGAIDIWNLIGTVKGDAATTAVTTLESLLTTALGFAKGAVAGVDADAVAKAASGIVTGMANQVIAVAKADTLGDLGKAAGEFTGVLVSKLGEVLGSDGFGENVGTAIGSAAVAIATGANEFAGNFSAALGDTDWGQFSGDLRDFVWGLLTGMISQIGPALYENSIFNPATREKLETSPRQWYELPLGNEQTAPNDLSVVAPDWSQAGRDIIGGIISLFDNKEFTPTKGPDPILSQHEDLLSQQQEEKRAAELGVAIGSAMGAQASLTFGWPNIDLLSLGFSWPNLDLTAMGFKWPEIAAPSWLGGFFDRADEVEASISSYFDNRSDENDSGGGGGGSGGFGGDDDDLGYDPNQPNVPFGASAMAAVAGGRGVTVNFNAPITIADAIDLETFKLEVIAAVRRGMG